MWPTDPCLPAELRPIAAKIDSAAVLIELGYDASQQFSMMTIGPLSGILFEHANVLRTLHVVRNRFRSIAD